VPENDSGVSDLVRRSSTTAVRLRDPFRVGNEPVGAFFKFEAVVPNLADDNTHEVQRVRWPTPGTPRALNSPLNSSTFQKSKTRP
jgi:hypothetical protein